MPRVAKRILLVLAGLLLAGLAAWTIWYQISTRRLEAVLEEARAAGYPLTFEALAGEAIPDEANAAVLFGEAFAMIGAHPVIRADGPRIFEDWDGECVTVGATGRRVLPELAEALERIARAGRMPACQFGPGTQDLPFAPVLQAGDLLAARVALSLEGKDLTAAEVDLMIMRDLARAIGAQGLLISELVEMCLGNQLDKWVRRTLALSPEPAIVWRRLELPVDCEHLREAIPGEIAFFLEMLEGDVKEPNMPSTLDWVLRHRWLTRPYLHGWAARVLRLLMLTHDAAEGPYPQAIERLQGIVKESREEFPEHLNPVAGVAAILRQEARQASETTATAIGARLLDHRRLHGSWPATLSDLAGDPVPLDPLTEKPFQLTREEGGLLLSSPDPDGGSWLLPE